MSTHVHPVPTPLILASASPRRKTLLETLGIPFNVVVSNEAEDVAPGNTPADHAILLAVRKARAVARDVDAGLVLGADTIVVLDGEILGKPAADEDAAAMLRRLSGREHEVITGVALVNAASGWSLRRNVHSLVEMRALSEAEIAGYVASGEPRDKAGAYAIQGLGAGLIAGFEGCYNNIVGLPLCAVASILTETGVTIPADWNGCGLPDGSLCPLTI